jgi:hypothetical protein
MSLSCTGDGHWRGRNERQSASVQLAVTHVLLPCRGSTVSIPAISLGCDHALSCELT